MDEKRRICEGMEARTAEVDAAMRADFKSLFDFEKKMLLDMLAHAHAHEQDRAAECIGDVVHGLQS